MVVPFDIPANDVWEFHLLSFLTSTGDGQAFNFGHGNGRVVVSHALLISLFMKTNNTEHLFMCLLAILIHVFSSDFLFMLFDHFWGWWSFSCGL